MKLEMLSCKFFLDKHCFCQPQGLKAWKSLSCDVVSDSGLMTSPVVWAPGGNHQWHLVTAAQGQWTWEPAPVISPVSRGIEHTPSIRRSTHANKMMPIKKTLVPLSSLPVGPWLLQTFYKTVECAMLGADSLDTADAKLSLVTPITGGVTSAGWYYS